MDDDLQLDDDGQLLSVVVSMVHRYELPGPSMFAMELASRIRERVPKDRRVVPPPAVAGRVLDAARWHEAKDPLFEMFAELLRGRECGSRPIKTSRAA